VFGVILNFSILLKTIRGSMLWKVILKNDQIILTEIPTPPDSIKTGKLKCQCGEKPSLYIKNIPYCCDCASWKTFNRIIVEDINGCESARRV
jgi:hypothetical protein